MFDFAGSLYHFITYHIYIISLSISSHVLLRGPWCWVPGLSRCAGSRVLGPPPLAGNAGSRVPGCWYVAPGSPSHLSQILVPGAGSQVLGTSVPAEWSLGRTLPATTSQSTSHMPSQAVTSRQRKPLSSINDNHFDCEMLHCRRDVVNFGVHQTNWSYPVLHEYCFRA